MRAARQLLAYDPNQVKPGWVAFFLVLFLLIATFLLWRSMNTQLSRIKVPPRASFNVDPADTSDRAPRPDDSDDPDAYVDPSTRP